MESVLEQAKSIPYHTTRSGLSFNHRGPQFDTNYTTLTSDSDLNNAFYSFFTQPADILSPICIDSPTLMSDTAFHTMLSEGKVPIFSVAESDWATQAKAQKAHLKEMLLTVHT